MRTIAIFLLAALFSVSGAATADAPSPSAFVGACVEGANMCAAAGLGPPDPPTQPCRPSCVYVGPPRAPD